MAATKEDIQRWIERGQEAGATHVIIMCDTFDWEDYPIYVMPEKDIQEEYKRYLANGNMQRLMEVYNLNKNIEEQLNKHRNIEL